MCTQFFLTVSRLYRPFYFPFPSIIWPRLFLNTALFLLTYLPTQAQTADRDTTIEALKRRTDFAKMYVGIDAFRTTGGTTQFANNGSLQTAPFNGTTSARILLGATHFWGHADLYIAIPVLNRQSAQNYPAGLRATNYSEGIETGLRVFPWAIEAGKLRPFVGVSFKGISFAQVSNDINPDYRTVPSVSAIVFPVQAGLWYAGKRWLVQAGANYQPRTDFQYPISRTNVGQLAVSPWSFNVGVSRWFNTNGWMASQAGVKYMAKTRKLAARNRLSSWYVGLGPSASFEISKSEYVKEKHPYLNQGSPGGLLPDITAGRYFGKADLNVGISYRKLTSSSSGYNTRLDYRRSSYMIEAYKFLGDYHGFVPFVGPTLAYEDLTFIDTDGNRSQTFQRGKIGVGLIFGWDIRLSRAERWLLRTNLRYTPNLHLNADDKKVAFDQMEFNFIQFVWFVGRGRALRE